MTAESVGTLIQRARQRKRLSQAQLAIALGVTRATVAKWENGTHFPLRKAGAIEDVLDIEIPAPEAASA